MKRRISVPVRQTRESPAPGPDGFSLRFRLFTFLALFAAAIMIGFVIILFFNGVFTLGMTESRIFLENELGHTADIMEDEFGTLSVEGVNLSKKLAGNIQRICSAAGVDPSSLKSHPELLESILRDVMDPMISALEKNTASAVFVTLDATVNPLIDHAEYSRAGLFIRNMEPNAHNRSSPSIHYLRGPISLARERNVWVLPQWRMEFRVKPGDFFFTTLERANSGLDISRQYYWNSKSLLAEDYDHAMLLCVPIITPDQGVLGVCGFEVNAMLFKLQNAPDNSVYSRVFSMLVPVENGTLDAPQAMTAGNFSSNINISSGLLISGEKKDMSIFTDSGGNRYTGMWRELSLYPKQAVHGGEHWAAAVMMPAQDLDNYGLEKSRGLLVLLIILFGVSIAGAVLVSRRYLTPLYRALDTVKSGGLSRYEKTHIREIDDLFSFLAEQDALRESTAVKNAGLKSINHIPPPDPYASITAQFNDFLKKLKTLSKAERAVFDLYAQGYSAQRITGILCLSMNTIKTHNRRIFMKLDVSSRKEMMVYVNMLKEQGSIGT